MRCEMETITAYIDEHADKPVPTEPLVINCKYEPGRTQNIILEEGVWRWNFATEADNSS